MVLGCSHLSNLVTVCLAGSSGRTVSDPRLPRGPSVAIATTALGLKSVQLFHD
jgi:hypothetical protein